ncbi:MAG: sodium:proton antiporter [Trueperaceae bacterium]|nr:sodium:proton antiporter [Trueperaceae bacterium]
MIELSPALAIAFVIGLGAAAQWLSWRVNIPAILPLLLIGFAVGPVLGIVDPVEFVGEGLLFAAVALAVGLILFEGGLTLRFPEVKETRRVVFSLVTSGAVITWLGSAAAGYWIMGLDVSLAFLFGALIIVTGPTVIGPLLRNVRPRARVGNVLKWEGILIDPIGAIVAVLVFEFIVIENRSEALGQTLFLFLEMIGVGSVTGIIGGLFLAYLLRRRVLPDYLINVVALAVVFTVLAASNAVAEESGLLATTVMGLLMANLRIPNIEDILSFKEDLSLLFISLLFIVLAANIELEAFMQVLTPSSLLLIAAVMLVVRPLTIFLSTIGSSLSLNEKLFLSWIAPRGIVAAAVTSLFATKLAASGYSGAEELVPLVFIVIVGTVTINSLSAKPVAQLLGIAEPDPQGFLIIGANPMARRIGAFLKQEGFAVTLADTNWSNVSTARIEGLNAYYGSPLSDRSEDELRLSGIGKLLALTSNDEANALAALKFAKEFGSSHVYQLTPNRSSSARDNLSEQQRGRTVFYHGTTYAELSNLFSRGGKLNKSPVGPEERKQDNSEIYGRDNLPLFVLRGRDISVVTSRDLNPEPGAVVVSLVLEPDSKNTASGERTPTKT